MEVADVRGSLTRRILMKALIVTLLVESYLILEIWNVKLNDSAEIAVVVIVSEHRAGSG